MADNDNKIFDIRRYVVIVPYNTKRLDFREVLNNALVNTAILLFWFGGAALFTVIRIGMSLAATGNDYRMILEVLNNKMTIYFNYLARVVGNSAGNERYYRKGESFLMFVIGVFATLTSMLFTGALFEQLIAIELPTQINTIDEMLATNMTIVLNNNEYSIHG